jgi:hypothetical protein
LTEPVIYAEDRAPDLIGTRGRAWKTDISAIARRFPDGPPAELTPCGWIVEAAWAHPVWHSYAVTCIALRKHPQWKEAAIHLPDATHSVIVIALNPDHKRPLNDAVYFLIPVNFCGQWIAESDEAAVQKIEETVRLIIEGQLSPDTDFRRQWIALFSSSNMKGLTSRPG